MNVRDFVRVLHRRWRVVAALVLLWLIAAVAVTMLSPRVYQADVEVFVSLRDGSADSSTNAYQGNLFSQQRVKSYAKIANSPAVTRVIIQRLGLELTPEELASKITATVPSETVLVDITAKDRSPTRARDIANSAATQFATVVGDLERPAAGQASPVNVTVVRPASLPTSPVSPRPVVNVALGVLLGLASGIGLAVLRDSLDTTIKTGAALQELTGSSALGMINYDSEAERNPLVSQHDSHSGRGEAFRTLRTNLRFVDVDHPPRVVVITSSVADEGKSTTACNLALALTNAGVRVILVEGDLRRPRIADYMGIEGSVGLTDVLIGRADLSDVLQPWGDSTLTVLTSGALPPNPSELLGSAQMAELLGLLRDRADIVLIDAPPLLPVTDAAVLAREGDGAIVVVRHGRTTREQAGRAFDALAAVGARVLGTVLNRVPTGGTSGYGYGYGYGYSSEYVDKSGRPKLTTAEAPVESRAAHRGDSRTGSRAG